MANGLFDGNLPPASPGLLGQRGPAPAPQRRSPNVLDRILGLYGADPATHIPEGQRKGALGEGLFQAGLATAMGQGRGHEAQSGMQAIGTFMGTMKQTGPRMAQQQRAARLQEMLQSGEMNPQQMQAIMMELIAAGDHEGARAVSEVLKSQQQDDRYMKAGDGLLWDKQEGQYIPYDGQGTPEVAGWRTNLEHPQGQAGQYTVPYDKQGNLLWSMAAKEGRDPYQQEDQTFRREQALRGQYEKGIKGPESAMRFISTGLDAVELARIRAGGGDLKLTGPEQINLLYAFIKGIDPESVVRTGEIDLAREAASLRQKIKGYIDKYTAGESVIVPGDMIEHVEQMLAAHKRAQTSYVNERRDDVMAQANRWGMRDAESLFRDATQGVASYSLDEIGLMFERDAGAPIAGVQIGSGRTGADVTSDELLEAYRGGN